MKESTAQHKEEKLAEKKVKDAEKAVKKTVAEKKKAAALKKVQQKAEEKKPDSKGSRKRKGQELRRCGNHILGCTAAEVGADTEWTSCAFDSCDMRVCPSESRRSVLQIHKQMKGHK